MLVSLLILLAMAATPLATPAVIEVDPEWIQPLGAAPASHPVIDGEIAYVSTKDGVITAFDTETGATLWQAVPGEPVADEFALFREMLLVPGNRGTLYVLDTADGTVLGMLSLGSVALTTPLMFEHTVVVADVDGTVNFISLEALQVDHRVVADGLIQSSGAQVDSLAIYATSSGILFAIDTKTGKTAWQTVLGAEANQPFVLSDGGLVVGTADGLVSRYAPEDGTLTWQVVLSSGNPVDYAESSNGLLVSTSEGLIVRLTADTGEAAWSLVVQGSSTFASDMCADWCIIVHGEDMLAAVATDEGALHNLAVSPGSISLSIAAGDDMVIAVTSEGDVTVWRLRD